MYFTWDDYLKRSQEMRRLHDIASPFLCENNNDHSSVREWRTYMENEMLQITEYAAKQPTSWFKEKPKKKEHPDYILTFTRDPKKGVPETTWKDAAFKQLHKTWFQRPIKYVYEHEDTNLHMHAHVKTEGRYITKDNFKMFNEKYGLVLIRECGKDNGIEDYMSKENPIKTLE